MPEEAKEKKQVLEVLKSTRSKLAKLTLATAEMTKSTFNNTAEAIQDKVMDVKTKSKERKEKKIGDLKAQIKDNGRLEDTPEMVILPNITLEQSTIMKDQIEAQILIVGEMKILSSRLDDLEKQLIRLGKSKPEPSKKVQSNNQEEETNEENFSTIGNEILTFLGATLLTLVGLFGVEVYIEGKDVLLFNTVPLLTSIWTVTAIVWSAFLFSRIGHINPGLGFPMFLRMQMSFGVGLAVFALATLNGSDSQTITDGWIWISILSTTALLGASLLATAWKFTTSLVSVKETVEVID
ncbi:hypothetical protein N9M84_02280 [Candidatus Poseidoniales archaeon]|nr:hypothetical protein [Candidatus Poseidoniales archaeon]